LYVPTLIMASTVRCESVMCDAHARLYLYRRWPKNFVTNYFKSSLRNCLADGQVKRTDYIRSTGWRLIIAANLWRGRVKRTVWYLYFLIHLRKFWAFSGEAANNFFRANSPLYYTVSTSYVVCSCRTILIIIIISV